MMRSMPITTGPCGFLPTAIIVKLYGNCPASFPEELSMFMSSTDDLEPEDIVRSYKRKLRDLPITWSCRNEDTGPNSHVMEDFFGMMQFDCLIRSLSNYTLVQSQIGGYQAVISPKHHVMLKGPHPDRQRYCENYIDEMEIEMR